MTLAESQRVLYHHNDTITRLEKASQHAFSYAMGITVGFGGLLCLLNAVIFVCLCKRARRQVLGESNRNHRPFYLKCTMIHTGCVKYPGMLDYL